MIPIAYPPLGTEEEDAIHRVLASCQLAQEGCLAAFERHFAEACVVCEAVVISSGTTSLHPALFARCIGSDDEVITTSLGFVATRNLASFIRQSI